jgi:hypothetical protein
MRARVVVVALCGVRPQLREAMQTTGLEACFDEKEVFLEQPVRLTSTLLAIRHAYTLPPDHCPTLPAPQPESGREEPVLQHPAGSAD